VVRFVLKDLKTGKILWEVPNDVLIEDYNTLNQNAGNEEEALAQIVDDISEKIYMGTLNALRRENMGK
jgi:propanediol dehydratase small subunit